VWVALMCGPLWIANSAIAQNPADAIKQEISDLTAKLNGLPEAIREDPAVKQQLTTLRDTIFGIDCLDPRGKFTCEFKKLKQAGAEFNAFFTADQQSQLTDADKADLKAGLPPLIGQLTTYQGLVQSKIFIRGAWFGDLEELAWASNHGRIDPAQDGHRFCSATRFVQTWCQPQAECTIQPASGDAAHSADAKAAIVSPLTGERICGYDPVPFAEDRIKGLLIEYQCMPERGGAKIRQFAVRRTAIATLTCGASQ